MAFTKLDENHPSIAQNQRPPLMALGDSLLNGTRSLTTGPGLAPLAVPAQVARGRGLPFTIPDYPRNVLFDLEAEMRQGINLNRIRSNIIANAEAWMAEPLPWSQVRCFDNISVAAATFDSLMTATAGKARRAIGPLLDQLKASSSLDFGAIGGLYSAINTAFLLNPTGDRALENLSAVEILASRRPQRVLMSIGTNDGLFDLGIAANPALIADLSKIPQRAIPLADALSQHCQEVDRFYVDLLIRPRALANLAPRTNPEMYAPPPGGGYFSHYLGRLGALGNLTAAEMEAADQAIAQTNTALRAVFSSRLGKRVRFIDIAELCDSIDSKHWRERAIPVIDNGTKIRLRNTPMDSDEGGVFSLDNMHPTTVGYAALSGWIGAEMAAAEGGTFNGLSYQEAFEADTLLQDRPKGLDIYQFVLSLAGPILRAFVG